MTRVRRWFLDHEIILNLCDSADHVSLRNTRRFNTEEEATRVQMADRELVAKAMRSIYSKPPEEDEVILIGDTVVNARNIVAVNFKLRSAVAMSDEMVQRLTTSRSIIDPVESPQERTTKND